MGRIANLFRKPGPHRRSGEREAGWYDRSFREDGQWKEHYTCSKYYFVWTVIADRLQRRGATSILDIGCGSGQLAALLHDHGNARYCGLDFSEVRIRQARMACPDGKFVVADAFETDLYQTVDYDAVISTEFLEHVERDTEIFGKIKSGVYLIATVPNFPYVSHVRHFRSEDEVRERYARYLDDFSVTSFYENDRQKTYYIFDGIVK